MKTTQRPVRLPLKIALSVVIFLLAVIGVLFGMALSDPNEPIAADGRQSQIASKLVTAVVNGEPARLSADEVSAFMTEKLAQSGQDAVRGVRFSISADKTVDVYLPVVYKGIKFGISANLTPGWDAAENQICAVVNSIKIGRLPLNPASVLPYAVLPQGIRVHGNILRVRPALLQANSGAVLLNISGFAVADNCFLVNISADADKMKEYFADSLKSYIHS